MFAVNSATSYYRFIGSTPLKICNLSVDVTYQHDICFAPCTRPQGSTNGVQGKYSMNTLLV